VPTHNVPPVDPAAPKHALPASLRVPIAASDAAAIELYVGEIVRALVGRGADAAPRTNAVLVRTHARPVPNEVGVGLWLAPSAAIYNDRLFPEYQVWVHVDYRGYRRAYSQFGLTIPVGYFLDHIQNRKAVRLQLDFRAAARERGYATPGTGHPYLRLCPVRSAVNTSGGVDTGGEGMEREYLAGLVSRLTAGDLPPDAVNQLLTAMRGEIVYADPMDLTKMLDILPGTRPLDGVRDTQALFFPANPVGG
jgi:hypothetical protein